MKSPNPTVSHEKPRVLVTGGAGFIGANLVRALLERGVASSVVVLDDLSTGSAENVTGVNGAELTVGSILDAAALDAACSHADTIVHLAARPSVPRSLAQPGLTHEVNATGTLQVLDAARRAGGLHTIVASSSSVYGDSPTLPKHEDLPVAPRSPYAASKLAAESYTLAYQAAFGLPTLAFRFFNVFGPLQPASHAYAAVIPSFVNAAVAGRPLTINGDGLQTRDFTFVGDVAAVLAEGVRRRVTHPGPVNLAFGTARSLLEVVEVLERVVSRHLDVAHAAPRPGDVRNSQADQSLLRDLFVGLTATTFDLGLQKTVDWFITRQVSMNRQLAKAGEVPC